MQYTNRNWLKVFLIYCLLSALLAFRPALAQAPTGRVRVKDRILTPGGQPRSGKVTFVLLQAAAGPDGLIPAKSSVTGQTDGSGWIDVWIYPSTSINPQGYYNVLFQPTGSVATENLGVYSFPSSTAILTLAPNLVTDTNLAARYKLAADATVQNLAVTAGTAGGIAGGQAATDAIAGSLVEGALPKWDAAQGKLVPNAGVTNSLPLNNGDGTVTWIHKDSITFAEPGDPIVTAPLATLAITGQSRKGERAPYTLAGLPTCSAVEVNTSVNITDSDRIPRKCSSTPAGYRWVKERPYIDLRDFGIDGTAGDVTSRFAAAIAVVNAGTVNEIRLPSGVIDLYSGVTVTNDKARIIGDSNRGTEFQIYHNGVAITYTPTVADLNESKPTFADFSIRSMMNGGDAVKATAGGSWVGTAFKSNGGYGMTLRNLHIRNFSKGLHLKDTAVNVYENINVRNCYWGLYSEGWSNTNTFLGGVFSRASINTGEDWAFESTTVKGTDFTFIGTDFEPGSQTNKIGNRHKFLNCRIEQLHLDTFPTFFTWFDFLGDGNVMEDCDFYFGGASLPSTNKDQFFFDFTGDNNKINFRRIFMHNKLVRFKPDSNNNEVEFSTKFEDYLIGAPYPGSERFIRDNGVGNRVIVKSNSGMFTRIGAEGFSDVGAIPSMLPQDSQAGLTLTRLTQAASDIAGPFGVPASSFFIKKYTVSATDAAGAFALAPTIALGGANQVYTTTAYVYLPSAFPDANKVGVGTITAGHEFVYGTDRKSRWLPLTQYYVPGAAVNVQPSIFTDAPSGTVFYVAFFSCLKGQAPAVAVPPATSQTYALNTILGTSSDNAWSKTISGPLFVGVGKGGNGEDIEAANASGGRISATDGQGSTRRAVVMMSPSSGQGYTRLFSYNYEASAGMTLALNDPGGNVAVGKVTADEKLDVNGAAKATSFKLAAATWTQGAGAPSGACVTGSLYSRTDGGAATTLYVCETAGWVAK